jgi:hypothetical protein
MSQSPTSKINLNRIQNIDKASHKIPSIREIDALSHKGADGHPKVLN